MMYTEQPVPSRFLPCSGLKLFYQAFLPVVVMLFILPAMAQEDTSSVLDEGPTYEEKLADFYAIEEEPSGIIFDFYVGGTWRGDVFVTYTNSWFELENAAELVEIFPALKDEKAVIELLSGRVEGQERHIEEIGRVKIDLNRFRIDTSLMPAVLEVRRIGQLDTSIAPPEHLSVRQNFNLTGNSSLNPGSTNLSLRHQTQPTKGPYRLDWRGTATKGTGYELTELAGAHETGEITTQVGLLETRGQRFATSQEFTGVSIGTTVETLFDDSLLTGTALEIFVPSRSRVSIFRGNRIIFNRILDFGLQQIDTSRFPSGSYDVRIEITEDDGNVITENRLFTKTARLVPRGKPEWGFQAGLIRDGVDAGAVPVWQGFMRNRLKDIFEAGASIYGSSDIAILEPSMKLILRDLELEAALSVTTNADLAWTTNMLYFTDWGSWNFNALRTMSGHDVPLQTDPLEFNALTSAQSVYSAGYSKAFWGLEFSANANHVRNSAGKRESYQVQGRYPLLRTGKQRLFLRGNVGQNDGDSNSGLFLTYNFSPANKNWNYVSELRNQRQLGESETSLDQSLRYDNRERAGEPGTKVEMRNILSRSTTQSRSTSELEMLHINNYSRLRLTGRDIRGSTRSNNLGVEASTSFIYTDDEFKVVAPSNARASLILELTGNETTTPMKIMVDNQHKATGRGGETLVIPLRPFRTYEIRLEPEEKDALLTYDNSYKKVTVFPGNVVSLEWKLKKTFILFGQLINENGLPLASKRIQGLAHASGLTDAFGNFEIEYTGTEMPYVLDDDKACTFALPALPESEYFYSAGTLVCL